MNPILAFVILIISFYSLAKIVDEIFIKSLDNISKYFNLSPSVSGATFMAAGTSAPELSTTLFALFLAGANPATGLGTVVGSAIFQILVVIGFAAIVKTSYLNWKPVVRDGIMYSISILVLIGVIHDNKITVYESGGMVLGYFIYLMVLIIWTKKVDDMGDPDPIELVEKDLEKGEKSNKYVLILNKICFPIDMFLKRIPDVEKKKKWTIPVFIISLALIAFASYWLVIGGEAFAVGLGVPSSIVALTILAGGTSVPEMIGSAIVVKEGRGDMAISNAIGSNIFDIFMSLGLPLFIYTLINGDMEDIDAENVNSSVLLLFATVVMVLLLLASQKFRAGRLVGGILIATYVGYVIAAYAGWLG
ncbi:MAG: calcium/sodium antiporter [Candidatus Dojkabacteria bacterium]|nr:calcium/sodium antiporter [Candidatus Dojkabacteria bacterium]MDQ7021247.1 calcium/sodium antiporter [Candidatus Dojkabacteria bacterium]